MAVDVPNRWRTIAIWALRVVLGLVFLYVGTTKLTGTGNTIEYFTAIGWGQWFRYLTGVSLTVLRGNPTWGSAAMVVVPLVLTFLAVVLAWLTRRRRASGGSLPVSGAA